MAQQTYEDTRGWWVADEDEDGELFLVAGPFESRNEAEEHLDRETAL